MMVWCVFINAPQTLEANTKHWLGVMKTFPQRVESLKATRKKYREEHRKAEIELQTNLATLKGKALFEMNAKVKALFLKRGACTHRIEHFNSMRWWITHHIRGNCRRTQVLHGMMQS
jgi:hypothetical protein